jgi:hypothetical protein
MRADVRLVFTLILATAAGTISTAQRTASPAATAAPAPQRSTTNGQVTHLSGRILAAPDGTPLRRVLISTTVGGRIRSKVFSDEEGRYEIEVPGGVSAVMTVAKPGFLTTSLTPPPARSGRATLEISLARSGVLSGRVVDPSGNPVVSVRVRLQRTDPPTTSFGTLATTDDQGEYRIAGLAPGRYRVETVGRPEYSSSFDNLAILDAATRDRILQGPQYAPTSEAVTVEIQAGAFTDATLAYREPAVVLPYANVGGVVTGQVSDEFGEPLAGLSVQPWRLEVDNGIVTATQYNTPRITDDRGQYRLFHLKAGRYVVIVTDGPSRTTNQSSWLPVYYPGTPSPADAVVLTVGRSQELGGTDMVFTHTAGVRVFGTALNAAGRPLRNSLTLAAPNRDLPISYTSRTTSVGEDGSFRFENVPPSDFVLRAMPFVPGSVSVDAPRDAEVAVQNLHVADADTGPLVVRTSTPATLRGRIVFEGMAPIRTNFEIEAFTTDPLFNLTGRSTDVRLSTAVIDTQMWTFELPRLAGPIRLRLTAVPPGTWLKSAYVGTTNAAESPVTLMTSRDSRSDVMIVIAGTGATLTGRMTLPTGRPAVGVQVVVFPTNRERWYIGSQYVQAHFSNEIGSFTITSLPPGDYYVVAIDSDENELQRRESEKIELFDSLVGSAQRITLGEGQTATVSPRIVSMGK